METFASSDNNHVMFYDYPFYKKVNKNGSMIELKNSEALAQAVKIWLVSKRNEKIRSRSGGIIYPYIGKMMDESRASDIKNRIIQGLKEDFSPSLVPVEVNVVPNYDKERWEIGIVAYNADLAVGVNTKVVITNSL
jgi:hypothetical protein